MAGVRHEARAGSTRSSSAPTASPPTATPPTRSARTGWRCCAKHHGIPFYVAAPTSTIDLTHQLGRADRHRGARPARADGLHRLGDVRAGPSGGRRAPSTCSPQKGTYDMKLTKGHQMIIDRKGGGYSFDAWFRITPPGIEVFNPAFDVTPGELITAFITERGVIRPEPDFETALALMCMMSGGSARARHRGAMSPRSLPTIRVPAEGPAPGRLADAMTATALASTILTFSAIVGVGAVLRATGVLRREDARPINAVIIYVGLARVHLPGGPRRRAARRTCWASSPSRGSCSRRCCCSRGCVARGSSCPTRWPAASSSRRRSATPATSAIRSRQALLGAKRAARGDLLRRVRDGVRARRSWACWSRSTSATTTRRASIPLRELLTFPAVIALRVALLLRPVAIPNPVMDRVRRFLRAWWRRSSCSRSGCRFGSARSGERAGPLARSWRAAAASSRRLIALARRAWCCSAAGLPLRVTVLEAGHAGDDAHARGGRAVRTGHRLHRVGDLRDDGRLGGRRCRSCSCSRSGSRRSPAPRARGARVRLLEGLAELLFPTRCCRLRAAGRRPVRRLPRRPAAHRPRPAPARAAARRSATSRAPSAGIASGRSRRRWRSASSRRRSSRAVVLHKDAGERRLGGRSRRAARRAGRRTSGRAGPRRSRSSRRRARRCAAADSTTGAAIARRGRARAGRAARRRARALGRARPARARARGAGAQRRGDLLGGRARCRSACLLSDDVFTTGATLDAAATRSAGRRARARCAVAAVARALVSGRDACASCRLAC